MMKAVRVFLFCAIFFTITKFSNAQSAPDSSQTLTLEQCISYALQHQPTIRQSQVNVSIARVTNSINEAGWLPQLYLTGSAAHYFQLPTGFVNSNGQVTKENQGVVNTVIPELSVTQTIFNPELMFASRSANLYVKQAQQSVDSSKINTIANVSQQFYTLLLTLEQIGVLKEDTARLTKNYNDSYHQYIGGIVDQTDYKEAAISLNNSLAQLKQAVESVSPQYFALKQAMGYPPKNQFNISFDTTQMMQEIAFDTTQVLNYQNRIEYQQLQTEKNLQEQLTKYYRSAYLPTASIFYNYYLEFENDPAPGGLFSASYPYSYIGLSLSMPIFTGFSRVNNIKKSKLQEQDIDLDEINLVAEIYSEYSTALASYKSNLANFGFLKDNVAMAKDVYKVVSLQYLQGTVAYLNVITAESNLITSEIGYTNALFQLLQSKISLEKAMGIITPNSLNP